VHLHFGLEGIIAPLVYVASIVAFFLAVFWRPTVALYVLIPLLPVQTVRYRLHEFPLGASFVDIMLLGALLGILRRREWSLPKPLTGFLAIFAGYTYLALWKGSLTLGLPAPLWVNDIRVSDWKDNLILPFTLFLLTYMAVKDVKRMKILLALMCLSMVAFNRNIHDTAGARDLSSFSYSARAESGGIGSNGLAAIEVQFGFFLLALSTFETRKLLKVAYLAVAVFSFYCMMLCFSRGAYAAFLLGWLYLGFVKQRKLLILFCIFLFTWQIIMPNAVRERIFMTYDAQRGGLESSAETRFTLWEDAMQVFRVDPVFGTGYDTYRLMHRVDIFTDTHNLYVKAMVELGITGLILFLLLFWQLYRLGYTLFRSAKDPFLAALGLGLAAWMVCALLVNCFGDRWNYMQISGYLWAITACVARGHSLDEAASNLDQHVSPSLHVLAEPIAAI
jgi:O-antigen ligase